MNLFNCDTATSSYDLQIHTQYTYPSISLRQNAIHFAIDVSAWAEASFRTFPPSGHNESDRRALMRVWPTAIVAHRILSQWKENNWNDFVVVHGMCHFVLNKCNWKFITMSFSLWCRPPSQMLMHRTKFSDFCYSPTTLSMNTLSICIMFTVHHICMLVCGFDCESVCAFCVNRLDIMYSNSMREIEKEKFL